MQIETQESLTQALSREHRRIERVVRLLARTCARVRHGGGFDVAFAERLLDFFRYYADSFHHAREEDILFPWMRAQGLPTAHGPLAVMGAEHEEGRRLVRELRNSVHALAVEPTDARARSLFIVHGEGFALHLARHIWKEDHILFPLADRLGDSVDPPRVDVTEEDAAGVRTDAWVDELEDLARAYPPEDLGWPEGCGTVAPSGCTSH